MGPLKQTREEHPELLCADRLLALLGAEEHRVVLEESHNAVYVTPAQPGGEPLKSIVDDSVVPGLRDAEMLARRRSP